MGKEKEKKSLESLFEFLESDSEESLDGLKEELKEDGVDFEAAEVRLQEIFSRATQKKKVEIRAKEKERMLANRAQFEKSLKEQVLPKDMGSKWKEISEISQICEDYPELNLKLASRNFKNISEEDLGNILLEIRALVKKDISQ